MQDKKDAYKDRTNNLTDKDLMAFTKNKNKSLVNEHKWAAPSMEEKAIIALEAQHIEMKRTNQELWETFKSARKKDKPKRGSDG